MIQREDVRAANRADSRSDLSTRPPCRHRGSTIGRSSFLPLNTRAKTILDLGCGYGELLKGNDVTYADMDPVIKYLTVRMDEDMKRLDKIKAHRQKRAARRGAGSGRGASAGAGGAEGPGGIALEEGEEE